MAEIGTTLTSTRCQYCGAITFIAGYDICEGCLARDTHYMPISDIADAIVVMDQHALPEADRQAIFARYHVTAQQVEAAQEEVEGRYKAAQMRRNRNRRW